MSTAKVIRPLNSSFGAAFAVGADFLKLKLQNALPVLTPRPRGRKRKRPISASLSDDVHVIDEVLLEGSGAHAFAILCRWHGLPIQDATWQPLADQTQDFREWWAEEREKNSVPSHSSSGVSSPTPSSSEWWICSLLTTATVEFWVNILLDVDFLFYFLFI